MGKMIVFTAEGLCKLFPGVGCLVAAALICPKGLQCVAGVLAWQLCAGRLGRDERPKLTGGLLAVIPVTSELTVATMRNDACDLQE